MDSLIAQYAADDVAAEEWNLDGLKIDLSRIFGVDAGLASREVIQAPLDDKDTSEDGSGGVLNGETLREQILRAIYDRYEARCIELRREAKRQGQEDEDIFVNRLEKMSILATIDDRWREHLTDIDDIKGGIHLRQYGQKDPVVEFKREAFDMFENMIGEIDRQTLEAVFKAQLPSEREVELRRAEAEKLRAQHADFDGNGAGGDGPLEVSAQPQVRTPGGRGARKPVTTRHSGGPPRGQPVKVEQKVSRNALCPCGSGKKYKYCCGAKK